MRLGLLELDQYIQCYRIQLLTNCLLHHAASTWNYNIPDSWENYWHTSSENHWQLGQMIVQISILLNLESCIQLQSYSDWKNELPKLETAFLQPGTYTKYRSICFLHEIIAVSTLWLKSPNKKEQEENFLLWTRVGDRGGTVVKVLRYKSEGRWFDSRWYHWNFSLT